jgi:hypothetical protein
VAIAATLRRSYLIANESVEQFLQRKTQFLIDLLTARSGTTGSTVGTLAICPDQTKIYTTSGVEAAGSNVQIGIGSSIDTQTGEMFFISDGTSYEAFLSSVTETAARITAGVLVNSYLGGARIFRASHVFTGAFLNAGIEIPGHDQEGINDCVPDIELSFQTIEDPTWGLASTSP